MCSLSVCPVILMWACSMHSFKNRTSDRTGETIGSGFYRPDHWFTGSLSGFLR
jgi:hypothetical protein